MKSKLLFGGTTYALLALTATRAHAQVASTPGTMVEAPSPPASTPLAAPAPPGSPLVDPSTASFTQLAPSPKETDTPHRGDGAHVGVLGGVGFPRPLEVEALLEFDHLIVLGVEYSALPTTTFSGVQTSLWALAADLRVFPFHNAFFIGLRAGKQHLSEMASVSTGTGTLSAGETADTTFINPRIGFLWNWHALAIGIDAGVQIPLLSTSSSTLPAGVSAPTSAAELSRTLSQDAIPTVDLLRLGVVL